VSITRRDDVARKTDDPLRGHLSPGWTVIPCDWSKDNQIARMIGVGVAKPVDETDRLPGWTVGASKPSEPHNWPNDRGVQKQCTCDPKRDEQERLPLPVPSSPDVSRSDVVSLLFGGIGGATPQPRDESISAALGRATRRLLDQCVAGERHSARTPQVRVPCALCSKPPQKSHPRQASSVRVSLVSQVESLSDVVPTSHEIEAALPIRPTLHGKNREPRALMQRPASVSTGRVPRSSNIERSRRLQKAESPIRQLPASSG